MRFDSQPPSGDEPSKGSTPDPAERRRRRTARSWTSPATPTERERFDKPLTETAWGWQRAGAEAGPADAPAEATAAPATAQPAGRRRSPEVPPPPPGGRRTPVLPPLDPPSPSPSPAPASPLADAGPVPALLTELRAELTQLREAFGQAKAQAGDPSVVTGTELAAIIEALGTTLGTGMASLLSDHRALLARDVEAAADRILEEMSQRLRASGAQTVDAVEERVRHVSAKGITDLSEQLELRLDQIQAEVTGLRAVMLEIPDQTVVTGRLDQLAEAVTASRGRESSRVSPAVTAAIEKSLAGPIEQLEAAIAGIAEEMTALRRRITLRGAVAPEADEPDEADEADEPGGVHIDADQVDEADDVEPIPVARRAPRKAAPAKATKKATPARRRGRS